MTQHNARNRWMLSGAIAASLLMAGCNSESNLKVHPYFSEGMVMQQSSQTEISGTALPGARITVSTDWDYSISTSATEDGSWSAMVVTPASDSKRHTLKVTASDTAISINDVVLGELWLATGQSNMEMPMTGWNTDTVIGATNALRTAGDSLLRFFVIPHGQEFHPRDHVDGTWCASDSLKTKYFSAEAYFFARELRDSLQVPVGVVQVAFGGAPARAWVKMDLMSDLPQYAQIKAEQETQEMEYNNYHGWLDSLRSVPLKDEAGEDVLETITVYDDYVNMSVPDIADWETMPVPGYWENHGLRGFDGVVWFSRRLAIPQSWVGKDLTLHLGSVDDRDVTYVNKTLVGKTIKPGQFKMQRVYKIPATAVNDNYLTISVRVIDEHANGGLVGCDDGKNMRVERTADDYINIEGDWAYCVVGQIDRKRLVLFDMPLNKFSKMQNKTISPATDSPSMVYNASIAPLSGIGFAGALCHMGEADVWKAEYRDNSGYYLQKIIETLRATAKNPKMPVLVTQISTGKYHGEQKTTCGIIRMSQQTATSKMANTYLVSTLDLGSVLTLRPPHKADEGHRLALRALAAVYDRKGFVPSGPMPVSATSSHQIINIQFEHAQHLSIDTSLPSEFEIASADSVFYPAKALASDNAVTVFSHLVPDPMFVRYAAHNMANATLRNEAGLPAPTFIIKADMID